MIEVGKIYRHFKGMKVKIIAVCKHTETLEDMVVYEELDNNQIWVRPLKMFKEKVDMKKYPYAKQTYRFEKIDD
jgi:hypothetical protein